MSHNTTQSLPRRIVLDSTAIAVFGLAVINVAQSGANLLPTVLLGGAGFGFGLALLRFAYSPGEPQEVTRRRLAATFLTVGVPLAGALYVVNAYELTDPTASFLLFFACAVLPTGLYDGFFVYKSYQ